MRIIIGGALGRMGRELGVVLEKNIPAFLVELGRTVAASGSNFAAWYAKDASEFDRIAVKYLA